MLHTENCKKYYKKFFFAFFFKVNRGIVYVQDCKGVISPKMFYMFVANPINIPVEVFLKLAN